MREVVSSWRTWLLAVTYFFVYLIRQGCTSWLVFYLLEAKGAVDAAAAALTVSGEHRNRSADQANRGDPVHV
jgi:sugar phosphate permease